VPAFFIAGAIGVFISQASVMKYLGPKARKVLAYGVASVSGSILAVCSCTILPLFAGIYRMGAGLGPAVAFLYSGPAINVLAIILTARILGLEIGIARAVGAVIFSVVIGLAMHLIYRREEHAKAAGQANVPEPSVTRPLWQNAVFFATMVGVLVFANFGAPGEWDYQTEGGRSVRVGIVAAPFDVHETGATFTLRPLAASADGTQDLTVPADPFLARRTPAPGLWSSLWQHKWLVACAFAAAFALTLILWFGVAWWKVVVVAIPTATLAMAIHAGGLWILVPFSAGVVGVAAILMTGTPENREWAAATWEFAKQILPLLLIGVLVAGALLGRPSQEGLIPGRYVAMLVGDSPDAFLAATGWQGGPMGSFVRSVWPVWTNLFASLFGALMYFATLTEVPILQGLIGAGMGKGPALALLLAGPALSLPNMLVIRSVLGTQKTLVFVVLVVIMAAGSGLVYGTFF
jgi:uncharacterized membrane protein YraQ (UPF0718 family)